MPLKEYLMSSPRDPRIGSVVYYDLDYAKDIVHAFIYDDISPEDYMKDHPVQKNDWYSQKVNYTPSTNNTSTDDDKKVEDPVDDTPVEDPTVTDPDTPVVDDPTVTDPDTPVVDDPTITDPDTPVVDDPTVPDTQDPTITQ